MDKLIPVINKLQTVFNTAGTALVQLPQIVVVGEQSSGKSSVLESIVGRSCLPRGINIVTRCPIVLQMVQMSPEDEAYRQKYDELGVEEWCEFPHLPEDEKLVTDFDKITDIINAEVNKRAGGNKGIVKDELILRILSPNVLNLTVVDLPGIVRNPTDGQPQDIEVQINDLITTYISNPNSIILAVSAANNDIATSESIKLAKTVDPNCDRTIAVLTKLDLMDRGTDATDVLTGKTLRVKLGIVGVVNRSYDDIKKNVSIEESIRKESIFLLENYPTIASVNGTLFLKTRLQKLLMEHIKKCLPPLQTRLTNMQIQAQHEIEDLGSDEPTNKSSEMLSVIEDFCNSYRAAIVGKNRMIQKKVLTGGAQINLAFEDKLTESLKSIVPEQDLQNTEILTTISNSQGIESSMLIPESAYQDLVRDQILRLETPALQCASQVSTEMINIMQICMTLLEKEMQRFPSLSAAISMEVTEVLSKRHLVAQELLKNYVEVQSSFIKTIQMDFNTQMLELLKANPISKDQLKFATPKAAEGSPGQTPLLSIDGDRLNETQKTQCLVVRQLVHNYFQIVKLAFQDFCPKAIAHAVIYFVERNIQRHLIERLHTPDKVEQLVKESAIVQDQRRHVNSKLLALESAIEVINDIRETHF